MDVTQRDKDVIQQVARFRFLRSPQIVKLVGGAPAQVRRRLQALYHHGWLDRPRCQIDYYHRGGSRPMVYGLGSRGAGLMRRECAHHFWPFHRMVWSRGGEPVGRRFLEHTLRVADVLIAAELAVKRTTNRTTLGKEEPKARSSPAIRVHPRHPRSAVVPLSMAMDWPSRPNLFSLFPLLPSVQPHRGF